MLCFCSTPGLPCKEQKSWSDEEQSTINMQDSVNILSETGVSSLKDEDDVPRFFKDDMDMLKGGTDEDDKSHNIVEGSSPDETVTESCSCTKLSIDESKDYTDSTVDKTANEQSDITAELRGTFTNHDRDAVEGADIVKRTLENAESTREGIDIDDTKCTSTPRKVKETTVTSAKEQIKDDGLIYTKIQPRNSMKGLTGNSIQLEEVKRNGNSHCNGAGNSMNSFTDGDSFNHNDASRDSGISEGMSFQSSMSRTESSLGGENTEKNRPRSPPSSSLSVEARQWLGQRGICIKMDSEDEGNYSGEFLIFVSHFTFYFSVSLL